MWASSDCRRSRKLGMKSRGGEALYAATRMEGTREGSAEWHVDTFGVSPSTLSEKEKREGV